MAKVRLVELVLSLVESKAHFLDIFEILNEINSLNMNFKYESLF